MKNSFLVSDVITLMFAQELGVTDNTDLIRANILGMEIERNDHTIESIKKTSAYMGCHYDIPFNDDFLQSLLDKKKELITPINEKYSPFSTKQERADKQVDFDLLKVTIEEAKEILKDSIESEDTMKLKNFILFFDCLKNSSSFAHLAHKKLNQ
jgi:hypothetical protein